MQVVDPTARAAKPNSTRRRLGGVLASLAIVSAVQLAGASATKAVICGGEPHVIVYEFQNYNDTHSPGYNGHMVICYADYIPDFYAFAHVTYMYDNFTPYKTSVPHICNGVTVNAEFARWDNCISAISWVDMYTDGSLKGCFYRDSNYGGGLVASRGTTGSAILSGTADNVISSFRWRNTC